MPWQSALPSLQTGYEHPHDGSRQSSLRFFGLDRHNIAGEPKSGKKGPNPIGVAAVAAVFFEARDGLIDQARKRIRTADPFLTMEVLYLLSYPGGRGNFSGAGLL